ncbi:MAG: dihydroorotase [Acidobacteriota bacterium]
MSEPGRNGSGDGASVLLRGGRVVDPSQDLDAKVDLLVENGRVARLGEALAADQEIEVVDVDGLVVVPGLIELRAQLGEPGFEQRETLRTGLAAAAAGGYTGLGALPATEPPVDTRSVVEMLRAEAARHATARLHPIAALSRRLAGEELTEMGELAEAGAVAVGDGARPQRDAALLRRALQYASHFDLPVFCRATDPQLDRGGVMHEGEQSTRLGLRGQPRISEESVVARDVLLAEDTRGRYHLAPVSTRGAVEQMRRAKERGLRVSCDVTPMHLLLTDEAVATGGFSTALRVDPPLRTADDVEALLEACADGTIDAITGEHRPHHADEKADVQFSVAPPGVSALETTVSVCLDRLVGRGFLSLARLVELLSTGPARILGVDGGSLAVGSVADVTLLDLEREVTIEPRAFRSLGRSTPFAGWTLRGAPVGTYLAGRHIAGRRIAGRRVDLP